eukprot:s809_g3.t1
MYHGLGVISLEALLLFFLTFQHADLQQLVLMNVAAESAATQADCDCCWKAVGGVQIPGEYRSTMLRLLMGEESARDGGTIRPADPKMTGFFAQHQADLLPMDKTGWQVVKDSNHGPGLGWPTMAPVR